ncbi:MAG TPA: hypothetical protein VGL09_15295 [Methylomirabilota bacterium]
MAVTRIKITFASVGVLDSADIWGDGDWVFKATIDGKAVGDPKIEWTAKERGTIELPELEWSSVIDVSGKTKATDSIKVTFSGTDIDVFSDDDLGEVKYEFKYPFDKDKTVTLKSPVIKGWLFLPDHQYYTLQLKLEVLEAAKSATTGAAGPQTVSVSRQHSGSSTFTTVSGKQILPRVEVCPVVPSPQAPSKMPKRPDIATANGLMPGKDTPQSQAVAMWPVPDLNATYNPSLIPILAKTDPDLAKKAAKLAVTYVEPGDLDTSFLTWHVKSGPIEILGSNQGPEIQAIGTGAGAFDTIGEIEVRWDGAKGPLLATYRVWVGKIKTVLYRINLINGTNAASSVTLSPQDYENQIKIARVLFWQAGLHLVADTNTTVWDGATTTDSSGTALPSGVFIVPVTNNTWTVNVNNFVPTIASRLNFRPGVLHAVYVRSTASGRAAATDIQGVDGKPYRMGGQPTASWVIPSGVPPEAKPHGTLLLKTFPDSDRPSKNAPGDDDYVKARQAADATFKKSDMARIYAAVLPSDWSSSGTDPNAGTNLAHELGHVLGLQHRGSGDANNPPLSEDDINCADVKGKKRGHPWHENVMTYGYGGNTANVPRNLDIDIIQTPVIRKHPACT